MNKGGVFMDLRKNNKGFFEVIEERFSCRSFTAEKITTEEINALLEAARLAPTAVNFQPQKIYVVENQNLLAKLNEATRFLFNAKTCFVVCYDTTESWHRKNDGKDHGDIDATIVATHMMLAATAIGLGSCYVCSFKKDMVREILGIPEEYEINCLLPVGYPKEVVPHNERKDIEDIVIYK